MPQVSPIQMGCEVVQTFLSNPFGSVQQYWTALIVKKDERRAISNFLICPNGGFTFDNGTAAHNLFFHKNINLISYDYTFNTQRYAANFAHSITSLYEKVLTNSNYLPSVQNETVGRIFYVNPNRLATPPNIMPGQLDSLQIQQNDVVEAEMLKNLPEEGKKVSDIPQEVFRNASPASFVNFFKNGKVADGLYAEGGLLKDKQIISTQFALIIQNLQGKGADEIQIYEAINAFAENLPKLMLEGAATTNIVIFNREDFVGNLKYKAIKALLDATDINNNRDQIDWFWESLLSNFSHIPDIELRLLNSSELEKLKAIFQKCETELDPRIKNQMQRTNAHTNTEASSKPTAPVAPKPPADPSKIDDPITRVFWTQKRMQVENWQNKLQQLAVDNQTNASVAAQISTGLQAYYPKGYTLQDLCLIQHYLSKDKNYFCVDLTLHDNKRWGIAVSMTGRSPGHIFYKDNISGNNDEYTKSTINPNNASNWNQVRLRSVMQLLQLAPSLTWIGQTEFLQKEMLACDQAEQLATLIGKIKKEIIPHATEVHKVVTESLNRMLVKPTNIEEMSANICVDIFQELKGDYKENWKNWVQNRTSELFSIYSQDQSKQPYNVRDMPRGGEYQSTDPTQKEMRPSYVASQQTNGNTPANLPQEILNTAKNEVLQVLKDKSDGLSDNTRKAIESALEKISGALLKNKDFTEETFKFLLNNHKNDQNAAKDCLKNVLAHFLKEYYKGNPTGFISHKDPIHVHILLNYTKISLANTNDVAKLGTAPRTSAPSEERKQWWKTDSKFSSFSASIESLVMYHKTEEEAEQRKKNFSKPIEIKRSPSPEKPLTIQPPLSQGYTLYQANTGGINLIQPVVPTGGSGYVDKAQLDNKKLEVIKRMEKTIKLMDDTDTYEKLRNISVHLSSEYETCWHFGEPRHRDQFYKDLNQLKNALDRYRNQNVGLQITIYNAMEKMQQWVTYFNLQMRAEPNPFLENCARYSINNMGNAQKPTSRIPVPLSSPQQALVDSVPYLYF